jgi:phosphoribosylformimino-5-aminoimidazole carboxamide ribotide isomerase
VIVIPAIDILGGRAVRLNQGEYVSSTVYEDDPLEAATRWVDQGAELLHVVDLDGAREGRAVNLSGVGAIVSELGIPVQSGGGVRDLETVESLLEAGVSRVVLGTAAIRDPDFFARAVEFAGAERIVVAVDARSGEVSVQGWTEGSGIPVTDAVRSLGQQGARRFLFTAIETDGTMEGPDLSSLALVANTTEHPVIASGGVGSLSDLESLADGAPQNVEAVIVGKALYEGRFTVTEAIEAARR